MKTAEVGVERLKACLALVEIPDAQAVKAMAEAIATLAKLAGELAAGRAAGDGEDREERKKVEANIVKLWEERRKKAVNG